MKCFDFVNQTVHFSFFFLEFEITGNVEGKKKSVPEQKAEIINLTTKLKILYLHCCTLKHLPIFMDYTLSLSISKTSA